MHERSPQRKALFGVGIGNALDTTAEAVQLAVQADREGLDLFSVSDHPYVGGRLDAYAVVAFALGATTRISGLANVTNLPTRPAPMLSRTVTSLSALSGGRIVLGMGAGGLWDEIVRLGVPRLGPGAAVRAFEEAVTLVKALSGGGEPVTFQGEFYQVTALDPAPVLAAPVWTGSNGPKSLAATGRVADGWIPGHAADWLSPRYRDSRPVIDEAAAAVGRDPGDIVTVYNLPGAITPAPLPATRDRDGRWIGGSVAQWVGELTAAVTDFGAAGFIHFPVGGTPPATQLALWSQEIAPAVRELLQK